MKRFRVRREVAGLTVLIQTVSSDGVRDRVEIKELWI